MIENQMTVNEEHERVVCPRCRGVGIIPEHDRGVDSHDENGNCFMYCPTQEPCDVCDGVGTWIEDK